MDIQSLRVFVSEAELQDLALKLQPLEAPVKNLTVRVTPEGVQVSGEATVMMTLPFESLWLPTVVDGQVVVQLVNLNAAGFPATLFRSLVLSMLKDAVKEPFITTTEEAIVVDVQEFIRREKLPIALRFEVQAVRCVQGGIFAEAGLPAPTALRPAAPAS